MQKIGASVVITAAALIASGALVATANAETFKGRCFGVNRCACKGVCKTPSMTARQELVQRQRLARDAQHRVRRSGGTFEKS